MKAGSSDRWLHTAIKARASHVIQKVYRVLEIQDDRMDFVKYIGWIIVFWMDFACKDCMGLENPHDYPSNKS